MTLDVPILKRLAPSMQRAVGISIAALGLGLLVLFLGILPKRTVIRTVGADIRALNAQLTQMRTDISNSDKQKKATDNALAECDAFSASGVIEPLLGSYAMRGKILLDPIALKTGFHIDNVRELPLIPLQLPKPAPEQRHYRQPVEFTGQGSYAQITAFIAQTEADHPLTTLSGLLILGNPQTPETHKAIITFEWPAKGEKIKSGGTPQRK